MSVWRSSNSRNWLELTEKDRFDLFTVWRQRQLKDASPRGPPILFPFRSGTIGIAPRIRGVILRPHRIDRPIDESVSCIMVVSVIVENVCHGIFSDRERQTIGIDRSSQLILSCFDLFGSTAAPFGKPATPNVLPTPKP
jgi:hypothetical protein